MMSLLEPEQETVTEHSDDELEERSRDEQPEGVGGPTFWLFSTSLIVFFLRTVENLLLTSTVPTPGNGSRYIFPCQSP